jgi:hypothetical protein
MWVVMIVRAGELSSRFKAVSNSGLIQFHGAETGSGASEPHIRQPTIFVDESQIPSGAERRRPESMADLINIMTK